MVKMYAFNCDIYFMPRMESKKKRNVNVSSTVHSTHNIDRQQFFSFIFYE